MYKIKLTLFLSLAPFFLNAAQVPIQYDNMVYEPDIKTVMLTQKGSFERFPAIDLNSNQQLELLFDELKSENDNYQYTFIHCSANWELSPLRPNEYLTGLFFENINSYFFSTSTFQVFTHYQIDFPTNEMRPKFSGNYILKVYRNFDENDIVLTRRFMVVEDKFIVKASANSATNPSFRFTNQEVDFTVDMGMNVVPNPMIDVQTVILQNLRWDNAVTNLKPRMINGKILDFNYEEGNLFDAGNEFRYFDIRSLRYLSFNVRRKYIENNLKHAVLYNDATRHNLPYLQTIDFNGKRVVDNRDNGIKDGGGIEGDYASVHFTYVSDKLDRDVYVFGELSDWQTKDEFKMEWNPNFNQYEATIVLKQAYYNYFFVTQNPADVTKVDLSYTEDNHMNAENDYHVLVYNKNPFMQYDELLGTVHCNSARR
ncbi:MAG: DUF5103 domain-containing protein [Bacteroidetes bacterium]|nr:DUF5103 domain-containing protein [Bacteroidota bacterium]